MADPGEIVDEMPLCGDFDGVAAFVVPTRRRPLIVGLAVNVVLSLVFLFLAFVGEASAKFFGGLGMVFFVYLGVATWRSLKSGASYYLTQQGLTLRDGGGTLEVPWDDVQGFTPVHHRKKLIGFNVRFVEGSLSARGSAHLWKGVNRQLGAAFLLRANSHVGGADRMAGLLAWCLIPEHRTAIGTEQGREAFRNVARTTV